VPSPSFATASGATDRGAGAINNNGQILGGCDDANSYSHAVLWENGTRTRPGHVRRWVHQGLAGG
jgi:probable HAF family extracellular repeat protein